MRICLVSQEFPPDTARGGIGTQTWNKARGLAAAGHTVEVVAAAGKPSSAPTISQDSDGFKVHRLPTPGSLFEVHGEASYWLGYAWTVFGYLRDLSASEPFDVIDFAEYGGEGFYFFLDRNMWTWTPAVVQLHGPLQMFADHMGWPAQGSDFQRLGSMMEDCCIRRADALMACSRNIATFTANRHRIPLDSIDPVFCGVDSEKFRPPTQGEGRCKRPTILFVGNIASNKGVMTVFDAVLKLREKYPDVVLQILGRGDADEQKRLEAIASSSGASDNVEFHGFVDRERLPEFYRLAWLFSSPAQHEPGVANVYLEAMASGCPVVASNTGAAPEAVEDGVNGYLISPGDVEGAINAFDRLIGDEQLRTRIGATNRRRIEEYFSIEKYLGRVLAVYQRAIASKQRRCAELEAGGAQAQFEVLE
jgi:glycosyltransferase involved in cell wall biosynthesis